MLRRKIKKHEKKVTRALELLPGAISWSLIIFPFIGSFFIPVWVAFFVLSYNMYWLYRSAVLSLGALYAHRKLNSSTKKDWLKKAQNLKHWEKVHHIAIIVTAKEPTYIVRETIKKLTEQTFPLKQITVVVAAEGRFPEQAKNAQNLKKDFEGIFGNFFVTVHPDIPGEVKGKSANMAWASKIVKKELIDKRRYNIDWTTITAVDVDSHIHPKYFSNITYNFLTDEKRYRKFYQGAVLFYKNVWEIPAPVRVMSTFNTVNQLAMLARKDRLINYSTYTTSLKMIDEIGYWDTDVIPEDWRIFFKSFFKLEGKVEVEPIFLPIHQDAAQADTTWKTFVNLYQQVKRWAWGVSDDPYVIKQFLSTPRISFWDKTIRTLKMLMDHILWPVHWFVITLGMNIPLLLNPKFSQTILGFRIARVSTIIMTTCLLFLVLMMYIDFKQRPERPEGVSKFRAFLIPLEFLLMPLVGFFFTTLPALEAHTRLMLGKYMEYRVTDKV